MTDKFYQERAFNQAVSLYEPGLKDSVAPSPSAPDIVAAAQRAIMANPLYRDKYGDSPVAAFGLANSALKAAAQHAPDAAATPTQPDLEDLANRFVRIIQDGMALDAGSKSIASIIINELLALRIIGVAQPPACDGAKTAMPDSMHPEPTELHRQAASMFFCWPTNAIDLAKKDSDLPELVEKLAQFIAAWERKGRQQCDVQNASDPVAFINARLTDLAEANALYGKDQRLNAPDKIARNNREISWLKDLRSMIALALPSAMRASEGGK